MTIDITKIDREQFTVKEGTIAGETCYLINPNNIKAKWTPENLYLRSIMVNSEGLVISSGFPKFFNYAEQPDIDPFTKYYDVEFREKLDGSLLICSLYKGEMILRTRGTFDASKLEKSGFELEIFKKKYRKMFLKLTDILINRQHQSFLFEWLTPENRIVIPYKTPELRLIGVISHVDFTLADQRKLDAYAVMFEVERPKKFDFTTVERAIHGVSSWKVENEFSIEGLCVYYGFNQQNIRKIKSEDYLRLHRMKSELASLQRVLEVYARLEDLPDTDTFFKYIENAFDFEVADRCREHIKIAADAGLKTARRINHIRKIVNLLKDKPTRKEQAIAITQQCDGFEMGVAFGILDGKDVSDKQVLMFLEKYAETE